MLGFPDREALSLMSAKRMGCLKSNGCMGGLKLGIAEGGGNNCGSRPNGPPLWLRILWCLNR